MVDPKSLSFSQRSGLKDLPTQLQSGTISEPFRNFVWSLLHLHLDQHKHSRHGGYSGPDVIRNPWKLVLTQFWVFELHRPIDEFDDRFVACSSLVKQIVMGGNWNDTLDFIEFLLRHVSVSPPLKNQLSEAFRTYRLAYDVAGGDTIVEVSGPEHAEAIAEALELSSQKALVGVSDHLKTAGSLLTAGDWPGSIRESIHSVEALVRQVSGGKSTFADAMKKIEQQRSLHPQLKKAFENLYNYSSDEGGVRHSFVDEPKGPIDENLALFFNHACAAFVGFVLRLEPESEAQRSFV